MNPQTLQSLRADAYRYYANMGGPMSRQRTEHLIASVLREGAGSIRLPRVLRAGLRFTMVEPLAYVLGALARCGLDDPEDLRCEYGVPAGSLLCRAVPDAAWAVEAAGLEDEALLRQALLLGLCTAFVYDPSRPVLWTRASLTRCVELYEPAGFYA